jgi:hypothetical protein
MQYFICYAEFQNLLSFAYKAFIFAYFGEKIVKMCCSAEKLFQVYLEP